MVGFRAPRCNASEVRTTMRDGAPSSGLAVLTPPRGARVRRANGLSSYSDVVPTVAALSAAGLAGVAGFQVALAAGAPGGRFAWGGAGGSGVLPTKLRVASAASAGLWLSAAGLVLRRDQRATRCIAGLLMVGSAMNAASPSRAEARLWAPTSLALAGLTAAAGGLRPQ